MSEHKFLRILKAYAADIPVRELAPHTRISERTIRDTTSRLRHALYAAILVDPARFGGAGRVLFKGGRLTPLGREILSAVRQSRFYLSYRQRHAPRLAGKPEENLLIEATARLLCTISLGGEETKASLGHLPPNYIAYAQAASQMQAHLTRHLIHANDLWPGLLDIEGFLRIATGAMQFHFPQHRFYDDLRRYLLANPLRTPPS